MKQRHSMCRNVTLIPVLGRMICALVFGPGCRSETEDVGPQCEGTVQTFESDLTLKSAPKNGHRIPSIRLY